MDENPQGTDVVIARQRQKRHLAAIWASLAGLEPGMVVADIGCGPGVLTREYAAMVGPGGRVYAIDNKTTYADLFKDCHNVLFMFQNYDSKIKLEQIPNIIFLTDRLQHVSNPEMVLQQVRNASGPETKLLITGYDPKGAGLLGTRLDRRIPPETLAAWVQAAGFRHGGIIDSADEHYALIAGK
jgi:2-polyprenyl-3-methyl-5-hydroxy-6-metoxy-1,4-benzoquinol methylase